MIDTLETLELAAGDVLLLKDLVSGRALYGLSGMVWVTQEEDPRDHLLGPGGAFKSQGSGRVVVQALKPSRVLVLAAGTVDSLEAAKSRLQVA